MTPLQQELIDRSTAIYPCLTPWEDGGDFETARADAHALLSKLKQTLQGASFDWTESGLTPASELQNFELWSGLNSLVWIEINNESANELDLIAFELGQPAGSISTTIPVGESRVFMVPIAPKTKAKESIARVQFVNGNGQVIHEKVAKAARANGSEGVIRIQLVDSNSGGLQKEVAIPIRLLEPAVLEGRVVSESDGELSPGRVYLFGSDGIGRHGEAYAGNTTLSEKMLFEIGSENRFYGYKLPFFYSDGTFRAKVPSGELNLTYERGYEHKLIERKIEVAAGENRSVELMAQRFRDMKDEAWISGDTHVHWLKNHWSENEDMNLLAVVQRAEDLNVVNNLTLFQYRPESQGGSFLKPDQFPVGPVLSHSDDTYHIQMAEEYRNDNYYGHLCFLNITELVQPVATGMGSGGDHTAYDWPLNKTAIEEVHAQGGISTEAHDMGPNHRSDVPVNAIMGLSDAFDQMTPANFYRFLDCGLKIPLGNGSDHPARTVGSARMYVKVEGGFTYENWIEGIRRGRTFTTSGPLIFLSVNGSEIGDTIDVEKGDLLSVTARVSSREPIGKFQVISNGQVMVETETSEKDAVLEFDITAEEARWFVARCSQTDEFSALKRVHVAHTSGIFVDVDGRGVFKPDVAQFWVNLLKGHKENVRANARYESDEQRQAQLDYIQSGIDRYEALIKQELAR
ncbi:CehA/McbA family metallohydrolase [Pelagicoccus mobilis]|nr:CehA/McbA family metallohydrolase [Pelagicoccus mobilis]